MKVMGEGLTKVMGRGLRGGSISKSLGSALMGMRPSL